MSFSIYLHIPFCPHLCPYCHFYRVPDIPDWKIYLEAVIRELDVLEIEEGARIYTFYVGGGTPTSLPLEFYNVLFKVMGQRYDMTGLAEATVETDGGITGDELAGYARAGFDRISFGLKSFNPRIRDILGAVPLSEHDPVAKARSAGFSSISLDLLYGIKGQEMEDFTREIRQVIDSDPDHISLYMLEEKENGQPGESDPDLAAAMFRESARTLRSAGYRQYEITNFSRPGEESLHNTVYWMDGDFIGLGPSAHSAITVDGVRVRWRNLPDIGRYLEDPASCREELSREEGIGRAREALILALRMTKGVQRPAFTLRHGLDPLKLLEPHVEELTELGLIRYSSDRVRLTTRGMLLSNEVFVRILDDG